GAKVHTLPRSVGRPVGRPVARLVGWQIGRGTGPRQGAAPQRVVSATVWAIGLEARLTPGSVSLAQDRRSPVSTTGRSPQAAEPAQVNMRRRPRTCAPCRPCAGLF